MPAFDEMGIEAVVKGMQQFSRDLQKMTKMLAETSGETEKVEKSSKKQSAAMKILDGVYQKVGHRAADFVRQLPGMAVQFVQLGAAVQRQTAALDNLARSYDTSADDIIASIQKASSFTIDRMTAMGTANRAMIFDVAKTPEEFERLATVAVTLGRAMGRTAVQSIDDFVVAAGRQSIMIADNLGLIIRQKELQDDVNRIMAETPGITESAAKKQAFLNEMLRAGEEKMKALGGPTKDMASGMAAVTTAVADVRVAFAEMAASAIDTRTDVEGLAASIRKLPETVEQLAFLAEAFLVGTENTKLAREAVERHAEAIFEASSTYEDYIESVKEAGLATREEAEAATAAIQTQEKWIPAFEQGKAVTREQANEIDSMVVAMTELEFVTRRQEEINLAMIPVMQQMQAGTWKQVQALGAENRVTEELNSAMARLNERAVVSQKVFEGVARMHDRVHEAVERERIALAGLAARLQDVSPQQAAQEAINLLAQANEAGVLATDDYRIALEQIQLTFGMTTEGSINIAAAIADLTQKLSEGVIAPEEFDAALQDILADLPPTTAELSEMARAAEEATREAEKLADEARDAAAATGDEFAAMIGDATAETDIFSLALFESADAAGADAGMLATLAGTLGIYTDAEIEAALAAVTLQKSIEELGASIAAGTITMEEAIATMRETVATLPEGIGVFEQSAAAHHSVAGANREEADARRAAEKATKDARRAAEAEARELERLIALTGDYFTKSLEVTKSTDEWALTMYEAADAAGISANELALLAGALDLYTEEQIEASLAAAAMQIQIAELAEQIAEGMGIDEAIEKFEEFRQELGMLPTEAAMDTAAIAAEIAQLTAEYNALLRAGAAAAPLAALLGQIGELETLITPAQYGFSGMVGPGYGGARLFMAGETPEHVNISPVSAPSVMSRQANVNMGGVTINDRLDLELLRMYISDAIQEAMA